MRRRRALAALLALVAGVTVTSAVGAANTAQSVFVGVDPPVRILDTRPPTDGPVGVPVAQPVAGGAEIALTVAGVNGVPPNATAVVLNVTAVGATAPTFITVYPGPGNRPLVSTLNPTPGDISFNAATVAVGSDGKIRFFNNSGSVNLIADLVGYYLPSASTPAGPAVAINDLITDAPSATESPIPGMAVTTSVAASQRLLIEWSGEVICGADFSSSDSCMIGFLLDGVAFGSGVKIKSIDVLADSSWSVHAVQRVSAPLTAGSHTISVSFADPTGAGGAMSVDGQVLSVVAF